MVQVFQGDVKEILVSQTYFANLIPSESAKTVKNYRLTVLVFGKLNVSVI